MTRFVGLDVSQKLTAICVVDDTGRRLWRGQCPTEPEMIEQAVRRHAGDGAAVGVETGLMTPWLVHELRGRKLELVCLDCGYRRKATGASGLFRILFGLFRRLLHVSASTAGMNCWTDHSLVTGWGKRLRCPLGHGAAMKQDPRSAGTDWLGLDLLEAWLSSSRAPEYAMDLSELDGFLAGIAVSP
ncbi:hypothetical protein ACLF3G_26155 [Falsiroseomonas sp. HC035]|uniref:hypothetical protein n=1 Tax=Falsiroseomonas sp. HC035 TaxID=3390999 RepID=UPI003D31D742